LFIIYFLKTYERNYLIPQLPHYLLSLEHVILTA